MQVSLLAARLTPKTCMHTLYICLQDVSHELFMPEAIHGTW